jgi:polysaccharide biosynthesis transport protein
MDTRSIQQIKSDDQPERVLSESVSISDLVEQLSGFVRRQFPIFVFTVAGAAALGLVYLFTTPPLYTANAIMLIDSSKVRILQQQSAAGPGMGDVPLDTAQVETQVEVFKSDNIGLSVIKEQRLTEDPEFIGTGGGFMVAAFQLASNLFGSSEPKSEFALTRKALGVFKSQRTITRVGRTYVLNIGYSSLSPGRAATIANGIADAYILDQLEAKYQATRRASTWLQERIAELRTQASVADRAVLAYKEKNNIVDVGGSNAVGGTGARLLGEQSLAELNTQLSTARSTTAEAKARLDRINEVMKQDLPDAAVTDSLHNEVINRLRNNFLDLSARASIWTARYGANHLATINLRTQMNEIRRSITDELGRIAESYKSDFEIAKSRQESLEESLASQVSVSQVINRDRLGLRELESTAQVYHTIYDNFLQRYMEAIQQQSFPITEARVISMASPPSAKSSPQTFSVLAIAGSLGLIFAFAAATLREAVDRVFRTTRQVEETLHTDCLAVLPLLKSTISIVPSVGGGQKNKVSRESADSEKRIVQAHREFLRHVVDEPLSSFAEAFRSIKVAADIAGTIKANKVIGITSTIPREGKSTVSSNLAELIAHAGKRVILLDGDLRNPTLTRSLAPNAKVGLLEVLGHKVDLRQAIYTDELTQLTFLPAVVESRMAHTNEILASDAFKQLIDGLRQSYDYIIVDFPPLAPVVDVRASTHVVDSYLYVVAWGETRMNIVQHQLASAPEIFDRLLGVVLNKANISVLERYEYYYGKYYYKKYYSRYGYAS